MPRPVYILIRRVAALSRVRDSNFPLVVTIPFHKLGRNSENAMAFIPVTDTARVELVYSVFQQVCENVIYVENAAPWTDVTLDTLGEVVANWWGSEMAAYISDSVTLSLVRLTDMSEADSFQVEVTPSSGNVGTRTSAALPLNVTLAIKFGTGLAGRSNRGRAYVVGLTEDQVTGNEIIAARATELVEAWEALNTELHGTSIFWNHVVVSFFTGGAPRSAGVKRNVVNYSTDAFVDSQRRRLSGRGQ